MIIFFAICESTLYHIVYINTFQNEFNMEPVAEFDVCPAAWEWMLQNAKEKKEKMMLARKPNFAINVQTAKTREHCSGFFSESKGVSFVGTITL